jgi:hypothetical protein
MLTKVKMLSAVMILSAAVATPAFAHSAKHSGAHDQSNFHGAYDHAVSVPEVSPEYFGAPERDPSRVGGFDTSRNPGG